ncbi:MAG: hypothetical protein V1872_01540 [bacterium]
MKNNAELLGASKLPVNVINMIYSSKLSKENEVTTPKFITFTIGFLLLVLALIADADGFIIIIDHANLLFHEAGHIFFGIFGNTLGLYGGTLGQLVFPAVTALIFLRQETLISFATSMLWLFENFFNIARYMADARAHNLPLVGSGEHDWTRIFTRWGLLPYDTTIASLIRFLGWLGLIATMLFVVSHWNQYKKGHIKLLDE